MNGVLELLPIQVITCLYVWYASKRNDGYEKRKNPERNRELMEVLKINQNGN